MGRVVIVLVNAFWGRMKADAREVLHAIARVVREKRTILLGLF